MKSILLLIPSIFVMTSCNGAKKIEVKPPVNINENLPLNQPSPSEADEDLSSSSKADNKVDAKPVTIIIGDYLDSSIYTDTKTIDFNYMGIVSNYQGVDLFNRLEEEYAIPQNSPYYRYVTNQFPYSRIIQSSKASATVTDAEQLMAKALEEIDENEVVDQIIINLGTLDFCLSTTNFSLKYQEFLASLLEHEKLESAIITIITPIDLTLLPYVAPNKSDGKYINSKHQFCPVLSRPDAQTLFQDFLDPVITGATMLSNTRTVFFSDISSLPMKFDQEDTILGFNLDHSGIEKTVSTIEDKMIELN